MYAGHRLDHIGGTMPPDYSAAGDALRLRTDTPLPAGLAALGMLRLDADNGVCRIRTGVRFEDAWCIRSEWVLTAGACQLSWPAGCWRQVLALPGRPGEGVRLHCIALQPTARLTLTPADESASLALERLVCRHLHPRQLSPRHRGASVMTAACVVGERVAPETLPSLFTLAWTRDLALQVELPLADASLFWQGVPGTPEWHGSVCRLDNPEARVELDCGRVAAVWRERCACPGGASERVVLADEDGRPVMRLSCHDREAWGDLLGRVLYSPRGTALSK